MVIGINLCILSLMFFGKIYSVLLIRGIKNYYKYKIKKEKRIIIFIVELVKCRVVLLCRIELKVKRN